MSPHPFKTRLKHIKGNLPTLEYKMFRLLQSYLTIPRLQGEDWHNTSIRYHLVKLRENKVETPHITKYTNNLRTNRAELHS